MKYILNESEPKSKTKFILTEDPLTPDEWKKLDWKAEFSKKHPPSSVDDSDDPDELSLKALWNKYYTVVWGDAAEDVKELGEPFQQELLKIGFVETINPFIGFVKGVIAKKAPFTNIFKTELYTAIHNAYVQDYIDKNCLKVDNPDSLIWWPALYNETSANNCLARLKLADIEVMDNIVRQLRKIDGLSGLLRANFINVMFSQITIKSADASDTSDSLYEKILTALKNNLGSTPDKTKFRPLNETAELLTVIKDHFGMSKGTTKEENVSSSTVQKLWDDTLKKVITNKGKVNQLFGYLASMASTKSSEIITEIKKVIKGFDASGITFTVSDISAYTKYFESINMEKPANVLTITKELLGLADIKTILGI